jgi:hypothetical protein
MVVTSSGCVTTETRGRSIESDTIQAIVDDPSGSMMPLKTGETIDIYTKRKINLSSWNVDIVKMVVKDANTTRIIGEIEYVCCDDEYGKEEITGNIVEVKLEDIEHIEIWESGIELHPRIKSLHKSDPGSEFTHLFLLLLLLGMIFQG